VSESRVDWTAIRSEYENGSSLRQLAAKYGVSKSVIGDRKYKEQWDQYPRTEPRTPPMNPNPTTRDVNAAVRVQTAIKLKLERNLSWDEIAAQAGYSSRGAAHHAVMRELERCITHDVKELRDQELYMLSQLQARCYRAGIDEKNKDWTWAIDRFNALSKRKSELMGMDIPVDAASHANLVVIREVAQGYLEEPAS
jgi:hypothetical protein